MNKFLTVACATTLLTSVAMAEQRTITVPTPKSITIVCSDSVKPGTVVLTNPPKFSCQDYDLIKTMVGTGITVGPDMHVNRIANALRRVTRQNQVVENRRVRKQKETQVVKVVPPQNGSWQDISRTLDDFGGEFDEESTKFAKENFPGIRRNRRFFVSSPCRGWVNINDILEGKCKGAKIKVN